MIIQCLDGGNGVIVVVTEARRIAKNKDGGRKDIQVDPHYFMLVFVILISTDRLIKWWRICAAGVAVGNYATEDSYWFGVTLPRRCK
jgi:hypothetical protein